MRNTMPAQSPNSDANATAKLKALGQGIRGRRKALCVSASVAAQAAGMSRVTLHRIEHGEPSVTMGAYLNALNALGLGIDLVDLPLQHAPARSDMEAHQAVIAVPPLLRLADYPQLQQLAWHLPGASELTPEEALGVYERNWRHLAPNVMAAHERMLLNALVSTLGKGQLLV